MSAATASARRSVWTPFSRSAAFRALYLASAISWVGSFSLDVASAWQMTSLAPSPMMVSLLQTAANFPFFLLALPSGALSDIVDRRLIMFVAYSWCMLVCIGLGALTLCGAMTPWLLLTLIFLLGVGFSMSGPAWNSLCPDLVPREEVESAVALVSAGYNMMRGVGAALGGVLVACVGSSNVFFLCALSLVALNVVLTKLKPPQALRTSPPERVVGAMKAGMRYLKHSKPLHCVLARTAIFVGFSSCLWALIPLLSRQQLHLSSQQYGLLISLFGFGNVIGATAVPHLRRKLSQDLVLGLGSALMASCLATLAFAHDFSIAAVAMLGGGMGWVTSCNALNTSLLSAAPAWVRARMLSIYFLVFNGCVAAGAILWGAVAQGSSMPVAFQFASGGLILSLLGIAVFPLKAAEQADVSAAERELPPELPFEPHPDHGPVVISVEYLIDTERREEFNGAIAALEVKRRRDGAFEWHLYSDLARPGHYIEMYKIETWGEYLRLLERSVAPDSVIERRVYDMHIGAASPKVSHLLAERRRSQMAKTKQYAKFFDVKRGGPQ